MSDSTSILNGLKERRTLAELGRFCLTGASNSVVDFGTYFTLTRTFSFWARHFVAASAAAYALAIGVSFILNNFWTFRRDGRGWGPRSVKFLTVSFTALGLHVAIFHFLTAHQMHDIVAKVLATAVGAVWNFSFFKFWAFAESAPVPEPAQEDAEPPEA